MRLEKRLVSVFLLLVPLVGACSADFTQDASPASTLPSDDAAPAAEEASRWVTGVLHVHSSYSDGAGSVATIANAAAAAGLDFVVLTDHWSLDALDKGEEGYRDGVLTLVGVEASTDAGHVLGLDLPPTPMRFGRRDPEEVLYQIDQLGGFALAAHPDADRDSFHWTGWDLAGYEGIEVFNAYSAYRRNGVMVSLAYFFLSPFWQTESVNWELDFDPALVATWDRMLRDRKLSGWAGVDAHGGIEFSDDRFIPFPSYERVFRMARNYLFLDRPLTGVLDQDRELVYEALQQGRGYVALNDSTDASQFRFWAETDGVHYPVGSDLEPPGKGDGVTLWATVPQTDVELRLFRDGEPVAESRSGELAYTTDRSGIYRVEARLAVRRLGGEEFEPWIVSNPISVVPETRIDARIDANGLPVPRPMPFDMSEVSEYPLTLEADKNTGCSSMDLVSLDRASFRARFELGIPPDGEAEVHTSPYGRCGAEDPRDHDLTGYAGLHFQVRGDGIYRVNVQLAGSDEDTSSGGEGWTVSFLTNRHWQDVTLPFDRFQPIRRDDGELDVSSIKGISFLFDTSNTIPGTSGEVEVRGVSLVPGF